MSILTEINVSEWPMWLNYLSIAFTIVTIAAGAHWLVEASSSIAKELGISELVIGLTIVSLGTSAPEFGVTLLSAIRGQGDISVGNIVGSNIFNLGFILGGCAIVRVIPTYPKLVWRDGLVLLASTVLLLALLYFDLSLSRVDGSIFIFGMLLYLSYLYKNRADISGTEEEKRDLIEKEKVGEIKRKPRLSFEIFLFFIGLCTILGGAHFLVESSTVVARHFGISDWVIGVTIVAAGTSAPEFATSLVGVLKGRYAMSAGNLIGSDIFNILGVLGLTAILKTVTIDASARISLVALAGMVLLVVLMMRTGWKISRKEGLILITIALTRWFLDFSTHGY